MRILLEIRIEYKNLSRTANNLLHSLLRILSQSIPQFQTHLFSTIVMVLPHEPEFEQVRTKIDTLHQKLTQSSSVRPSTS